jgi:hypothetical protein
MLAAALALLALGGAPSAVRAAGDVVVSDCSNDTQLRAAAGATGTSRITFSCGAGPITIQVTGYTAIQGDVTIDGGGTVTLDGNSSAPFFQVYSTAKLTLRGLALNNGAFNGIHALENFGDLTLDSVQMQNNRSTVQAGAIFNSGALTVRSSTFSANRSGPTSGSGGAIENAGGTAVIAGSTFTNNLASGPGARGGAISVSAGSLSLSGGSFTTNSAFDGGAIYVDAAATASITETIFLTNSAGYGGAIENHGTLSADGALFQGNHALTGDGGAIWQLAGSSTIARSTLTGSQAITTGGAVSCYAGTLALSSSTISGSTSGGHGSAIYSACATTITNSTLSGNSATGASGGGGLYLTNATGTVTAATIANHRATFGAGVYHQGSGTLSLRATLLAANTTGNCDGVVASLGYNMSSDMNCSAFTQPGDRQNALLPLGPLQSNGGPTPTHLPLSGSAAINAIATPCPVTIDQRGVARPQGSGCEVGAVELGATIYLPLVVR